MASASLTSTAAVLAFSTGVAVATACTTRPDEGTSRSETRRLPVEPAAEGRLTARPRKRVDGDAGVGRRELADGAELYVPPTYDPDRPAALVVTLHGAGGAAASGMAQLLPLAAEARLILLAPKSRRPTWDVMSGGYGPDVAAIDRLLEEVFAQYAIDPQRVFVSGFSDGASYALSLGLTNGDLFDAVVAFSPGFFVPGEVRGKPRIFISHGTEDAILPIHRTSRQIVPQLRDAGYEVEYREFEGPHTVPPAVVREAVAWLRQRRR